MKYVKVMKGDRVVFYSGPFADEQARQGMSGLRNSPNWRRRGQVAVTITAEQYEAETAEED